MRLADIWGRRGKSASYVSRHYRRFRKHNRLSMYLCSQLLQSLLLFLDLLSLQCNFPFSLYIETACYYSWMSPVQMSFLLTSLSACFSSFICFSSFFIASFFCL